MSAQTESRQARAKALLRQMRDLLQEMNPYDLSDDDKKALNTVLRDGFTVVMHAQNLATLGAVALMQADIMAQAVQAIQKFREHMDEASVDKPQEPVQ